MPFIPDDQTTSGFIPDEAPVDEGIMPDDKSIIQKISSVILPQVTSFANIVSKGPQLGSEADELNKKVEAQMVLQRDLINRAKQESDPDAKADLLAQSRALSDQLSGESDTLGKDVNEFMERAAIRDEDLSKSNLQFATERGVALAGETGVFLLPQVSGFGALGKGASAFDKIARGSKVGLATGTLSGATTTADGFEQRLKNTAFGGLSGWALGAALTAGFIGVEEGGKQVSKLISKMIKPLKNQIGRQQLASFLGITDRVVDKADDLNIDVYDELIRNDMVDDAFSRVENTRTFKDEFGETISTKFRYAGQDKADEILMTQEKILKDEIKKQGTKIVVGRSKVQDGLNDFIEANAADGSEAKSAMKYVDGLLDKQFGSSGTLNSTDALAAKRFLYERAGNISSHSSLKKKAILRAAQMINRSFKGKVGPIGEQALREEQIAIFLRDQIIPKAGRTLYREGAKSVMGLSQADLYKIGRDLLFRAGGGSFFAGPAGGIAGAATTLPGVASKIIGPENIAGSLLKPGTQQAAQQGTTQLFSNLGLVGGVTGARATSRRGNQ